jgi:hypothetical protein
MTFIPYTSYNTGSLSEEGVENRGRKSDMNIKKPFKFGVKFYFLTKI